MFIHIYKYVMLDAIQKSAFVLNILIFEKKKK